MLALDFQRDVSSDPRVRMRALAEWRSSEGKKNKRWEKMMVQFVLGSLKNCHRFIIQSLYFPPFVQSKIYPKKESELVSVSRL